MGLRPAQLKQVIRAASTGSRIIADGKTVWTGSTSSVFNSREARGAWEKKGADFEEKMKSGKFFNVVIKDFEGKSWVTAETFDLTGFVNQTQMEDWSSANNEVIGDWDGKKVIESSMDSPRNPDLPDHFEIKRGGKTVHVQISPYSWMNPHSQKTGFSLSLEKNAPNIGREFIEVSKAYSTMKKADVLKLANDWLKKNGVEALEKAKTAWADHRKDSEKLTKKLDKRDARDDAAAKKTGMKFKIVAVVEPRTGSDFTIGWHSIAKPSAAEIKRVLKLHGSETFTNYKITEL